MNFFCGGSDKYIKRYKKFFKYKINEIFFCGGSNTHYSGNPQMAMKPSDMYPDIVSKHYGATYINLAVAGGSNRRTIRKIFYEYNMEEYDLICIDFTPQSRTEFYNDEDKRWENMSINNHKLSKLYYENFYNDKYGLLMGYIEFATIKKYLRAIKKPHLIFNSSLASNDNNFLSFVLKFSDYDINDAHLTLMGHKQVAKEIIKYYENFLQRG